MKSAYKQLEGVEMVITSICVKMGLDSGRRKCCLLFGGVRKVSYRTKGMEKFTTQGVAPAEIKTYGSL